MTAEETRFLGISQVQTALSKGLLTRQELARRTLKVIEEENPCLNAYLAFDTEMEERARCLDRERGTQLAGELDGAIFSIKDLLTTRAFATTAGSKVPVPDLDKRRDAAVIRKLKQAGAMIIGKCNLHEFAFGVTSENAHFGPVRNPWANDCISGGSSGGSAAAVAAGLSCASIGTDTRGSIRIPSACCGVSGLKPTFGKVSTDGVIPLSWSLDHVGPIARTVEDLSRVMRALGSGAKSSQAVLPLKSIRIGIVPSYYVKNLSREVEASFNESIQVLQAATCSLAEIEMQTLEEALEASDVITRAEAVTYHDTFLKQFPSQYGDLVRQRLETGYQVSGLNLVRAGRCRLRTVSEFRKVFRKVDCLAAPTLPVVAPQIGSTEIMTHGKVEPIVFGLVRLNAPQNVAGIPALSIPCGFSASGLPIGLQLISWRNREDILIELGRYFQQETSWHLKRPAPSRLR